jgi:hypothetical protein
MSDEAMKEIEKIDIVKGSNSPMTFTNLVESGLQSVSKQEQVKVVKEIGLGGSKRKFLFVEIDFIVFQETLEI